MAAPKDTFWKTKNRYWISGHGKTRNCNPNKKITSKRNKNEPTKQSNLIDKDKFVQLGNPEIREVRTIQKGNGKIALGIDQTPYKLESSWIGESNADYYLIDVETGEKRLIVQNKSLVALSPGGNFVVWYNSSDSCYYSRSTNINSTDTIKLTKQVKVSFCDERWDMPGEPSPYGIAGWAENGKYIFIYDRYDIWRFDLEGTKVPVSATHGYGRRNSLRLRYQKLDPEEEFIDTSKPVIVIAFDERNKSEGFFNADLRNYSDPKLLLMEDYHFEKLKKAKKNRCFDLDPRRRERIAGCMDRVNVFRSPVKTFKC